MPKRVGYLYEQMCDKDKIRLAILKASQHKRHRHDVQRVLNHLEKYVDKTYDILMSGSYYPSKPNIRERYDSISAKWRSISIVPFWPDGVMQQLMVSAIEPVLMRGMYAWSCASIPKRGASLAEKYLSRQLRRNPKAFKYVLKMDIKKFYPSIEPPLVLKALERKIKDKKFLNLVKITLDSYNAVRGIPIGFYICQWLANFFLEPLDRYITTLDGVMAYTRYMDDLVITGNNKKKLHKVRKLIDAFARTHLHLEIKNNWQVFPLKSRCLDFVGIKMYREHKAVRKRTFLRFTRQCRRAMKKLQRGKRISYHMAAALISRVGIVKRCNCLKARQKYYDPIGEKMLKEVIRHESKRRLLAQRSLFAGGYT